MKLAEQIWNAGVPLQIAEVLALALEKFEMENDAERRSITVRIKRTYEVVCTDQAGNSYSIGHEEIEK